VRVRTWGWACALLLLAGCDDEDAAAPATIDRSLLDSSVSRSVLDAGSYEQRADDAASLGPGCATLDVCTENEPGLLYNVCITGTASGLVSQPACLVDPNGLLYLAPLTSGQLVRNQGWTQSTDGTLSAADQARCEGARAALLADAAAPPKCAGGS
jgi:hypothetical protein